MSLRFIVGRAGTGKTHLCLEEIKSKMQEGSGKSRILLVPEQATFQMEKQLLEHCGLGGTMDTQVLSFQRLAWRVLQETGGGTQPVIDELGKSLVLRLIIEQNKDVLTAFRLVADKPGFIAKLRESITEFKVYQVGPEKLAGCAEKAAATEHPELQAKLADLTLIYEAYERYIADKYLDSDDYLDLLARKLHRAVLLEDAEIWVDGFHGFTPAELNVLRELFVKCRRVNVSLCLDADLLRRKLSETELFYPSWETYQRLLNLAAEVGCPLEPVTIVAFGPRHRFSDSQELAELESYLATGHFSCPGQTGDIKLVAAGNRRIELEAVAQEIIRLCRDEGFRYKDMGLLLRNLESYEGLLPVVFGSYDIPYFTDYKKPLLQHPLLDLIKGVLEMAEKGWNYEAVFRCLKTDLVPISREEADLLENYCLAFGLKEHNWLEDRPWTYRKVLTLRIDEEKSEQLSLSEAAYLQKINKARQKVIQALRGFVERLKDACTGLDYVQIIYDLLAGLAADRKLEFWANQAEKDGYLEEAQIHSQVWQKFIDLLDQLAEVLGEEELTLEQFSSIMESGLESIEMGLIPLGLDQVLIGSVDRSRKPALKAVFVLGVNEGILPARYTDQRLLNDRERLLLKEMDVTLAPTGSQLLFAEQFVIYNALTRAGKYLWLSYPLSDEEGNSLSPSQLISRLAGWLQACGAKPVLRELLLGGQGQYAPEKISHPVPALNELSQSLRLALQGQEIDPHWFETYNWYQQRREWHKPLQTIIAALWERNTEEYLPQETAQLLYGLTSRSGERRLIASSISRLEKFRACPFAYFLNYGLHLREREEYKLKSPDLGQLFHAALEGVYINLRKKGLSLPELDTDQLKEIVSGVVDELIPDLQNELLLSTARYRYLTRKLKRIVRRAVAVLREHERKGAFRPVGVELSFGPDGTVPGLQLTLRDGTVVELQGRIDRADEARGTEGYYLRVIDYKSWVMDLDLLEVYYGIKLQLLTYLRVLLKNASGHLPQEVKPGGVLYFAVRDPLISGTGPMEPEKLEKKLLRELKMKGYVLKDEEAVKAMDQEISGYSDLIPVGMNNGEFYQNSHNLLTIEQFDVLFTHVERILSGICEEILAGSIKINPYKFKGKKACEYCLYQAICRFDPLIPGYNYNYLSEKEPAEVWTELGLPGGENNGC